MVRIKLKGIVLALWPFLLLACVSIKDVLYSVEGASPKDLSRVKLQAVQTRSGDYYRFRSERPGRVVGDQVVGDAIDPKEFALDQIKSQILNPQGEIVQFADVNGQTYKPVFALERNKKLLAYLQDSSLRSVSLPFSDISTVTIRRTSGVPGLVISAIAFIAFFAIIAVLASSSKPKPQPQPPGPGAPDIESCPFIYSYDSENYVLDAEPYGGAICPGLERTEWIPLDHVRDVDGRYRIAIANELEEREHTDELKLIVVDHPEEALVVPDAAGGLHAIVSPQTALKATDDAGRNIAPLVAASDGYFWTGHPEMIDPEKSATFRDSLTFEFPKPVGARRVKLVAGAWTTHQGSASAKAILALHGRGLDEYYQKINAHGPAYGQLLSWYANEELYMLKVWVETKDGWKARGLIYGGGPFVAKEKAYVLDVSDVPGETLRVRLNPPLDFWMLDRLAVDYSPDLGLWTQEISAASAVDQNGKDVRGLLAANDGVCYEMPNRGDRAELAFNVPPRVRGLARTVLLKAAGYYDIRLEAGGEAQRELLEKVYNEPGFALRFTYEWRQRTFYAQARPGVH